MRDCRAWFGATVGVLLAAGLSLAGVLAAATPIAVTPAQRGDFLVASRGLNDPNFSQAVVLIVEHNSVGSLGVIVNRRSGVSLASVVKDLAEFADQGHALYFGGPVSVNAVNYLVRRAPAGASLEVLPGVVLGGTRSALRTLLAGRVSNDDLRVYGGFAGWAPGQLMAELEAGDWHLTRARADDVFSPEPDRLWSRLLERVAPSGQLTGRPKPVGAGA